MEEPTAQLLLVKKGSPQHVYPRVVDLGAKFEEVGSGVLSIGRSKECGVRLPEGEVKQDGEKPVVPAVHSISRVHCKIRREKGVEGWEYFIDDNKATNGTFINWVKVVGDGNKFKRGDKLCFGGGGKLTPGEKLAEDREDQPPVAYLFYTGTAPPTEVVNGGAISKITMQPPTSSQVAIYSQVSNKSMDGQLELAKKEQLQQQQQPEVKSDPSLIESSAIFSEDLMMPDPVQQVAEMHPPIQPPPLGRPPILPVQLKTEDELQISPKKRKVFEHPGGTPSRRRMLLSAHDGIDDPARQGDIRDDIPSTPKGQGTAPPAPISGTPHDDHHDHIMLTNDPPTTEKEKALSKLADELLASQQQPKQPNLKALVNPKPALKLRASSKKPSSEKVATPLASSSTKSEKTPPEKVTGKRKPATPETGRLSVKRSRPTVTPMRRNKNTGLPALRSGFDMLCADKLEELKGQGKDATRHTLIKAWRNLSVSEKEAYEKRAAEEKAALIKEHPELALLNPNQVDEETRLLEANGKSRTVKNKNTKAEGRALMRAARAKLFEDLDKSDDITRDLIEGAQPGEEDPSESAHLGDTFQVESSKIGRFLSRELEGEDPVQGLSERLLGRQKETILILPKNLSEILKKHQTKGVQFLWKNLVSLPELVPAKEKFAGGCILAHGMGLGKTLTTIAFILMWLRYGKGDKILIVAPKSTLKQWSREFVDWCGVSKHEAPALYVIEGTKHVEGVREWAKDGGVLVMSYAMFVRFVGAGGDTSASPRGRRSKGQANDDEKDEDVRAVLRASQYANDDEAEEQAEVEKAAQERKNTKLADIAKILCEKTDLVVIDEGHKISSPNSALTRNLRQMETLNRIVLTGTPMQSNMRQYHTMIDFVRPDSWDFTELTDLYTRASTDASARTELAFAMTGFIQRFDCRLLRDELPPLTEYILYTKPTSLQRLVYTELMTAHGGDKDAKVKTSRALAMGAVMSKLCSHTHLIRDYCMSKGVRPLKEVKSCNDKFDFEESNLMEMRKGKALYNKDGKDFSWALPVFKEEYEGEDDALRHNGKTQVLLDIVEKVATMGEKMVVFCDSSAMLSIVERYLSRMDTPQSMRWTEGTNTKLKKKAKQTTGWRKGTEYHRLDGTMGLAKRQAMCDDFNNPNSRAALLLISTRSGGLGINLVGATRVVLYSVGWNAQTDLQAIYRSYRYGQTKPVSVYRLVAQGTVEQTLFARTAAKMQMAMQVLEDKWTRTDLKSFDTIPPTNWSNHASKDAVLQYIYTNRKLQIHSVLLHDSLRSSLDTVEEQMEEEDEEEESEVAASLEEVKYDPPSGRHRTFKSPAYVGTTPKKRKKSTEPDSSQDAQPSLEFIFSDSDDE